MLISGGFVVVQALLASLTGSPTNFIVFPCRWSKGHNRSNFWMVQPVFCMMLKVSLQKMSASGDRLTWTLPDFHPCYFHKLLGFPQRPTRCYAVAIAIRSMSWSPCPLARRRSHFLYSLLGAHKKQLVGVLTYRLVVYFHLSSPYPLMFALCFCFLLLLFCFLYVSFLFLWFNANV